MLRDGNGAVWVVVVLANLLQLQRPKNAPEDDVEQLHAVHVVHDGGECDGDGDLYAVSLPHR